MALKKLFKKAAARPTPAFLAAFLNSFFSAIRAPFFFKILADTRAQSTAPAAAPFFPCFPFSAAGVGPAFPPPPPPGLGAGPAAAANRALVRFRCFLLLACASRFS